MKKTQRLSKLKFKNFLIDMNKFAILTINLILLKKLKSTKNSLKKLKKTIKNLIKTI